MTIERLTPGNIVMLTDPLMGAEKLGLVDDTGLGYYDIHGADEVPKPLLPELSAKDLGAISSWSNGLPIELREPFVDAWNVLTDRNLDVLTIARGLLFGLQNQLFDPDDLAAYGHGETLKVLKGRELLANIE